MSIHKLCQWVILVVICTSSLKAQDFNFTTLTDYDYINDLKIHGDTLWIGTYGGLQKRNLKGELLAEYNIHDGLAINDVRKIFIDFEGNKYLYSLRHLTVMDAHSGEFTIVDISTERFPQTLTGLVRAADGKIFISQNGRSEVVVVDEGDTTLLTSLPTGDPLSGGLSVGHDHSVLFSGSNINGFVKYQDGEYTKTTGPSNLRSVSLGANNTVWGLTGNTAVTRFDNDGVASYTANNSNLENTASYYRTAAAGNRAWAMSTGYISMFQSGDWVNYDNPVRFTNAMVATEDDRVFIGSNVDGLLEMNSDGTSKIIKNDKILSSNNALFAIEDLTGNVWVGTDFGVTKIDGSNSTVYTWDDGIPTSATWELAVDSKNQIWIANNDGMAFFDGTAWTTIAPGIRARSILVDDNDVVWFGSLSQGLFNYDGKDVSSFKTNGSDWYNSVYDIALDDDGVLWIGTNAGLGTYHNGDFNLVDADVSAFTVTHDAGKIYVGTTDKKGIYIYEDGVRLEEIFDESLFGDFVITDIAINDGKIYSTTDLGLGEYSNGKWTTYGRESGVGYVPRGILFTDRALWVSTFGGLSYAPLVPNSGPTDISMSTNTFDVESTLPARLGKLSSTDPDPFDTHNYTLLASDEANNEYFEIREDSLWVISQIPESLESIKVNINSTDAGGASHERLLTITLTDSENDVPVIEGYNGSVETDEDNALNIELASFQVNDPDNTFPNDFSLDVKTGSDYTVSENSITPAENFFGELTVNVSISDGENSSEDFALTIQVNPVNDAPLITDYIGATSFAPDTEIILTTADFNISDPDNSDSELSLTFQDGNDYTGGTSITPASGFEGTITVSVVVSDGAATADPFSFELTIESPLSFTNEQFVQAVKISPNPSQGEFELSFVNRYSNEMSISIRSLNGQEVYSEGIIFDTGLVSKKVRLQAKRGMYLLAIQTPEGLVMRRKILIQ